jgi:predicted  nucleic acid-binding Zn-ribbon protein
MLPDIASAVRLQELDLRLTELTKEIASLPKHIAEIEKKLEAHQRKLEADRAALSANQKDRRKFEGDIQMQEQKISKLRDQMSHSKVTNEQYKAFQHEIGFCEAEIRRAEDRILDLMSESEGLEKNVKAAEIALKAEKAEVEAEKQSARERTEADQKALGELESARKSIVASMTPGVYANYERIRGRRGSAVAEVVDGRCSVCHIAIRPQFLQDVKRGEQVLMCESCQRILYYNPPASFEDLNGPSASAMHT